MESAVDEIRHVIEKAVKVKQALSEDKPLLEVTAKVIKEIVKAFRADRKVLLCGNGGSAADAQHIAAELSGRFYTDRDPLFAEALHVNTSYMTAVANDYTYEETFSRLVQAKGRAGDVLLAISTSGNSPNVVKAVEQADKQGMITVGLTGSKGGQLKSRCKYLIDIPSEDTPRIQEVHILIGHIICEQVEKSLFENK